MPLEIFVQRFAKYELEHSLMFLELVVSLSLMRMRGHVLSFVAFHDGIFVRPCFSNITFSKKIRIIRLFGISYGLI